MKPELTQDLKERFFALYWGQPVWGYKGFVWKVNVDHMKDGPNSEDFLALRSIQQITDSETIEVAKIAVKLVTDSFVERDEYGFTITMHRGKRRFVIYDDCSGFTVEDHEKGTGWFNNDSILEQEDYLTIWDYLRSIGVALPFLGHSVEELIAAGWVKLTD